MLKKYDTVLPKPITAKSPHLGLKLYECVHAVISTGYPCMQNPFHDLKKLSQLSFTYFYNLSTSSFVRMAKPLERRSVQTDRKWEAGQKQEVKWLGRNRK